MLVNRVEIHKILVRMASKEDPDKNASSETSDLGLYPLSRLFWQATSVFSLRTSTIYH